MKTADYMIRSLDLMLRVLVLLLIFICVSGCSSGMSEYIPDNTAGKNGSFEVIKSGLPVNWIVYTPKTIPTGDFSLIIDTIEYKDGEQSLKFLD